MPDGPSRIRFAFFLTGVALGVVHAQNAQPSGVPILSQKCFQCHGEFAQMSSLDLHTRAAMLKGGDHGPAIVPGNAEASLLYRRITGQDKPAMPLAPLAPLTPAEIATIKEWIIQGAAWPEENKPAGPAMPPGGMM